MLGDVFGLKHKLLQISSDQFGIPAGFCVRNISPYLFSDQESLIPAISIFIAFLKKITEAMQAKHEFFLLFQFNNQQKKSFLTYFMLGLSKL